MIGKKDKIEYVLSKENAELEIEKLFDYYELDLNEIEDKELKRGIKQGYSRLVKAARLGRLQIKIENGIQVIQTLKSNGDTITYKEIDGNSKCEMAGKQQDDFNGKMYALMGSLSEYGETAIKKLKGVDLALVEVLGMIFLSV